MVEVFDKQPISMTEVTLRDGMQQRNLNVLSIDERIDVFESLVDTGMERIEIGHLGNEDGGDIAFARQLTERVVAAEAAGSDRYKNVEFQILLGTQDFLVERGVAALEGLDKSRVIVHVYDRVSEQLRGLAQKPYSIAESASRVFNATKIAYDLGFTNFSISGEGASDPKTNPKDVINFYASLVDSLLEMGADSVNCNYAITFGNGVMFNTPSILKRFNETVKKGRPNVTTSIHPHADRNAGQAYSKAAIRSGFDRIEGTMIGMGERAGNVALSDVIVDLIEDARYAIDTAEFANDMADINEEAHDQVIWDTRRVAAATVQSMSNMFATCVHLVEVFGEGAEQRFQKTSLGSPTAYDAGSGPHAQAKREYLRDPLGSPIYLGYDSIAIEHAILGRPEAIRIIQVDPDMIKDTTVDNHAAGGSTHDILDDKIEVASKEIREESERRARAYMKQITDLMSGVNPAETS